MISSGNSIESTFVAVLVASVGQGYIEYLFRKIEKLDPDTALLLRGEYRMDAEEQGTMIGLFKAVAVGAKKTRRDESRRDGDVWTPEERAAYQSEMTRRLTPAEIQEITTPK